MKKLHLASLVLFKVVIVAILIILAGNNWSRATNESDTRNLSDLRRSIDAFRTETNQVNKMHALLAIRTMPAHTPEDLSMIYQESQSLESSFSQRISTESLQDGKDLGEALVQSITNSTDPTLKQTTVDLLNQEEKSNPEVTAPILFNTPQVYMREKMSEERYQALLDVIVQSGNREALPTLRRLSKRKDRVGFGASGAIAQLKDPADLEVFVQQIKTEAHPMVDLTPYGPKAVDRLMQDIDNPSTPPEVRMRMIGFLNMARTRESLPRLVPLLHHKDSHVAEVAAETIGMVVGPNDESLVLSMINDPRGMIRVNGVLALRRLPWTPQYGELLLKILQEKKDSQCKQDAADLLGQHKYTPAIPTLRQLMQTSNKDGFLRESARGALWNMGEK